MSHGQFDLRKPLDQLRAFVRYEAQHGGYVWAAVTVDGDLLCEQCCRDNYKLAYRDTRDYQRNLGLSFVTPLTGWEVIGLTCSGESEETESCANCNKVLWES